MHVVNPLCCGIDVHSAQSVACLRRFSADGQITLERRECGPTYSELLALGDWLVAAGCQSQPMGTGVLARRGWNRTAVADKNARTVWALLRRGGVYGESAS